LSRSCRIPPPPIHRREWNPLQGFEQARQTRERNPCKNKPRGLQGMLKASHKAPLTSCYPSGTGHGEQFAPLGRTPPHQLSPGLFVSPGTPCLGCEQGDWGPLLFAPKRQPPYQGHSQGRHTLHPMCITNQSQNGIRAEQIATVPHVVAGLPLRACVAMAGHNGVCATASMKPHALDSFKGRL
jgi:hypothetical protein